jgi:hypothetical protein
LAATLSQFQAVASEVSVHPVFKPGYCHFLVILNLFGKLIYTAFKGRKHSLNENAVPWLEDTALTPSAAPE